MTEAKSTQRCRIFLSRYVRKCWRARAQSLVLLAAIVFAAILPQPQARPRRRAQRGAPRVQRQWPKLTAKSTARPTTKSTARPTAKPSRENWVRTIDGADAKTNRDRPGSAPRKTTVASRYRRQRPAWHPAQADRRRIATRKFSRRSPTGLLPRHGGRHVGQRIRWTPEALSERSEPRRRRKDRRAVLDGIGTGA